MEQLHELLDAIVGFPKFLALSLCALIIGVLTDWDTAVLAFVAILLCFAIGPLIGLPVVLTLYVVVRLIGNAANVLAGRVATQINFLGRVIENTSSPMIMQGVEPVDPNNSSDE